MTKVNAWLFSFIGFSLSKVSNYFMNSIFTWRWNISWVHSDTSVLKVKVKMKSLSRVRLFATPWTVAYQASLSMGFSRQEYWSGLPFPSPGDLPNPGTEPLSPKSPALASRLFTTKPPRKPRYKSGNINKMFQLRQCWSSSIFLPRHIGEMTFRIWIYSSE